MHSKRALLRSTRKIILIQNKATFPICTKRVISREEKKDEKEGDSGLNSSSTKNERPPGGGKKLSKIAESSRSWCETESEH